MYSFTLQLTSWHEKGIFALPLPLPPLYLKMKQNFTVFLLQANCTQKIREIYLVLLNMLNSYLELERFLTMLSSDDGCIDPDAFQDNRYVPRT